MFTHLTLGFDSTYSEKKKFRFEQMWLSNLSCEEVVYLAWGSRSGVRVEGEILNKIEKCGKELCRWEKNVLAM